MTGKIKNKVEGNGIARNGSVSTHKKKQGCWIGRNICFLEKEQKFSFQKVDLTDYLDVINKKIKKEFKYKKFKYILGSTLASSVVKHSEEKISEGAIVERGGRGVVSDMMEIEDLKYIKNSEELTPQEKTTLGRYIEDISRGHSLNIAIEYLGKPLAPPEYKMALEKITQQILHEIQQLKEGQSLYLNYGHLGHSMSIHVKRSDRKFILTLFESSGGLNRYFVLNSILGMFKLPIYGQKDSHRQTGLQIEVSDTKLFSRGSKYFQKILNVNSNLGRLRQLKIQERTEKFINKYEKRCFKWMQRLFGYLKLWIKWRMSVGAFCAVTNKKPKLLSLIQTQQEASNCYAKRIQVCEAHAFGKSLYKKVRALSFAYRRDQLLNYARKYGGLSEAETNTLKKLPIVPLTFVEREDTSTQIGRLTSLAENYKDWEAITKLFNHHIAMSKLTRSDKSSLGDVSRYNSKVNLLTKEELKKSIVLNKYLVGNRKVRAVGVPHEEKWLELTPIDFMEALKKFPDILVSEEVARYLNFFSLNFERLPENVVNKLDEIRVIQLGEMQKNLDHTMTALQDTVAGSFPPSELDEKILKLTQIANDFKKFREEGRNGTAAKTYFLFESNIRKYML